MNGIANITSLPRPVPTPRATPVPAARRSSAPDSITAYSAAAKRVADLTSALAAAEGELPALRIAAQGQAKAERDALAARVALVDSILGE